MAALKLVSIYGLHFHQSTLCEGKACFDLSRNHDSPTSRQKLRPSDIASVGISTGRDGHVREHHHRSPGNLAVDRGHEHRSEALAHRQREPSREQASRGNADPRPSHRNGPREEMRYRRPPEGSYRGAGHRDVPRDSGRGRDSYMRHDVEHSRGRDSGRELHHHGSRGGRHVLARFGTRPRRFEKCMMMSSEEPPPCLAPVAS